MTNHIKSDFDKVVKKLKLPKKNIDLRLVKWGLGLQLLFGIFILVTPFGKPIFSMPRSVLDTES